MPIDVKEIEEFFTSDNGKEFLNKKLEEATEGLKNKKDQLLGNLLKEKEEKKSLLEKFELLQDEKTKNDLAKLEKDGDIVKIREQLQESHKEEIDKITYSKNDLQKKLDYHILDQGITAALVEKGIALPLLDAAKALLSSKHSMKIEEIDNKLTARIEGRDIKDFISDWSQGDTGKHFMSAANNSGGGSNGANSGGKANGGKTMTRSTFDQMGDFQKSAYMKDGGRLVDN